MKLENTTIIYVYQYHKKTIFFTWHEEIILKKSYWRNI